MNMLKTSEKQKTILRAARDRFARFGLAKVTMEEIAADVGLGKASLYYYFPAKEDLFRSVIESEQEEFLARMGPVLAGDLSIGERLHLYVERRLEFFAVYVNLSKLGTQAVHESAPVFKELFERLLVHDREMLERILAQGVKDNEVHLEDYREVAELLVRVFQALRFVILRQSPPGEAQERLAQVKADHHLLVDLLLHGIHQHTHFGKHING